MPTSRSTEKDGILLDNQRRFVSMVGRLCELLENHADELLVNSISKEILVLGMYEMGPVHLEPYVLLDYSQLPVPLAHELVMLYLKEYVCAIIGDYHNATECKRIQDELRGKHEEMSKLASVLRQAAEKQSQEQPQEI